MKKKYDFSGWATRNDLLCSDGRTIRRDAFKDDDGKEVPIVWNHQHKDISAVLGHGILKNEPEGVKVYGWFNDTPKANIARELLKSRDIQNLSIWANDLKQESGNVLHGTIREVSLVLAGANPGALIDYPIIQHSQDDWYDEDFSEAIIHTGEEINMDEGFVEVPEELEHSDDKAQEEKPAEKEEEVKHADKSRTVEDIYNTLNDEQKALFNFMIAKVSEDATADAKHSDIDDDDEGGEEVMKHNVFDKETDKENTLSQSAIDSFLKDSKKGSMQELYLEHAADYGIDGIEWLFPEARELNTTPEFIKRDMGWVDVVMNGVGHSPFSRVKTSFADITEDEARARGYLKGNRKKEEVFTLLKRSTEPQTIYKKQKLDRDDVIDITDFDVVAWIKAEMRMMLNEEIARAILIGDGRSTADDDHIKETNVRPIANDADLFTIKSAVVTANGADDDTKAKAFIRTVIKSFKNYKGAARPTMFTTSDKVTDMLLLEDQMGRQLYETETQLATKMRVGRIVEVPVMENAMIGGKKLLAVIVDLGAYKVGADKGGAINMFEDFDIDYNQQKYLIETRISGALVKPYSAIAVFEDEVPTSVDGGITYSKTTTSGEGDGNGN